MWNTGGLFVHPASRNTWYQAWRGTVMSIFTELKGSQALRDRVAPVHGVIIVWLGILWIICVCMWVWVCACVSFHMEGHWGEINHWCTSFELLNTPCCFTTKRSTTLFEREVHHHKRGIFSNVYHCCHQVSLSLKCHFYDNLTLTNSLGYITTVSKLYSCSRDQVHSHETVILLLWQYQANIKAFYVSQLNDVMLTHKAKQFTYPINISCL